MYFNEKLRADPNVATFNFNNSLHLADNNSKNVDGKINFKDPLTNKQKKLLNQEE
jgi:hypothetical protein